MTALPAGAAADFSLRGDFSVALWMRVPNEPAGAAGGLASQYDAESRTGFSLSAISSAGGYNGPGDELRIAFGIDRGSEPEWLECGRPSPVSNYVSNSLTVFDGSLYAACSDAPDPRDRGHVYRWAGGTEWEDYGQVGREGAHGVGPLLVQGGALYAATWNYDWTRVETEDLSPCRVYRLERPSRWQDCGQPGDSRRIFSLGMYRGDMYAVGDDHTVHVYRGAQTWERIMTFSTYAHPQTIHDGVQYYGTLDPATVWSFDGSRWVDLGNPLGTQARCSQIHSLVSFRGALHMGSWPLGRVARLDASGRWVDVGRLGDSTEINALTVYNGKLYGGAIPRGEVFRYERDHRWTSLRRFFGPPGWRPVRVANMARPPNGDRRMREWTRVTSLTQHAGLLFASIGSCTAASIDAPADVRGTVHALRAGVVATTAASLTAGWRHIAAVRRGGRLAVYVDGRESAKASGSIDGPIQTESPLRIGRDETGPYRSEIDSIVLRSIALDHHEIEKLAARRPAPTMPA